MNLKRLREGNNKYKSKNYWNFKQDTISKPNLAVEKSNKTGRTLKILMKKMGCEYKQHQEWKGNIIHTAKIWTECYEL